MSDRYQRSSSTSANERDKIECVENLHGEFSQQLEDLSNKRLISPLESRLYRYGNIGRCLLEYLSEICEVDLFQVDAQHHQATGENEQKQRNKPSWRVKLMRTCFVYGSVRLIMFIVLQYIYDYNLLQYQRYQKTQLSFHGTNNMSEIISVLGQKVERSRANLKSVGAPFLAAHFMVEPAFIFMILINFMFYLQSILTYRYVTPFDFSLIRMIIDKQREQKNLNNLILGELKTFITSSRSFVHLNLRVRSEDRAHIAEPNYRSMLRVYRDHNITCNWLKQMATTRQSATWLEPLSWLFIELILSYNRKPPCQRMRYVVCKKRRGT